MTLVFGSFKKYVLNKGSNKNKKFSSKNKRKKSALLIKKRSDKDFERFAARFKNNPTGFAPGTQADTLSPDGFAPQNSCEREIIENEFKKFKKERKQKRRENSLNYINSQHDKMMLQALKK